MKKSLLLLLAMLLPISANPLKPFLWKNRILLIHSDQPLEQLKKERAEVAERNLIVIRLSASKSALPNEVQLTSQERKELRERYQVTSKDPATFILIGKDGGEKDRQMKKLELKKFFALIDTMPMRKAEMRK